MCRAVKYFFDGREWEVNFAQRYARLPVYSAKTRQTVLSTWGRRPTEQGQLPMGGWARRNNIHGGQWDKYQPKSVRIAVHHFMELDVADNPHWFVVTEGHYLQGLLATWNKEQRLYVVTLETPPDDIQFERWPRVIGSTV